MTYSINEVFRTAHKYMKPNEVSFGDGLPHGINQVCRCCKSIKTSKIIDPVELKPWLDFYKTFDFAAYECESCGYKFSWYKNGKD
tara:strand:- start:371 stop:625 length:255 start_codon:yes stop_codon:yes gene_type:complete